MEPRYPKSDPRPKLALPEKRIDNMLNHRCSHLLKDCDLENCQRLIARRKREKKVSKNLHMSAMRSLWGWLSLLNVFSGRSLDRIVNDLFVLPVSRELCGVSKSFNIVW